MIRPRILRSKSRRVDLVGQAERKALSSRVDAMFAPRNNNYRWSARALSVRK